MKRPARNADEQDCFNSRKVHGYLSRPGAASKIKRRARRRERRQFDPRKELHAFLKLHPKDDTD